MDEESQLHERFLVFKVQEVQPIAAEGVEAQTCVSTTKLAEIGYDKVFRLVMTTALLRLHAFRIQMLALLIRQLLLKLQPWIW